MGGRLSTAETVMPERVNLDYVGGWIETSKRLIPDLDLSD
jgi:hypothetical protein